MRKPKGTEKAIETAILDYLNLIGIFAFKVNTTGTWDPKNQRFRKLDGKYTHKGVSNIIGIFPLNGRFLAIQVKTPTSVKKVSEEQRAFLDAIEEAGGIAFVATSVAEVEKKLNEYNDWLS